MHFSFCLGSLLEPKVQQCQLIWVNKNWPWNSKTKNRHPKSSKAHNSLKSHSLLLKGQLFKSFYKYFNKIVNKNKAKAQLRNTSAALKLQSEERNNVTSSKVFVQQSLKQGQQKAERIDVTEWNHQCDKANKSKTQHCNDLIKRKRYVSYGVLDWNNTVSTWNEIMTYHITTIIAPKCYKSVLWQPNTLIRQCFCFFV